MALVIPEVGWLATQMFGYGLPMTLALLGVAVTMESGNAGDEQINDWFDALSNDDDSVWALNQYYLALEAAHPHLSGYLGAVTSWTENPHLQHYEQLRSAAQILRTICWSQFESVPLTWAPALFDGSYAPDLYGASGDILGAMFANLSARGEVRTQIFEFTPVPIALMEAVQRGHLPNGGAFMDSWCGSGTRGMAWLRLSDMLDVPHSEMFLNDPNGMHIAMAGMNLIGAGCRGKVMLRQDRKYAELWAAGMTTMESRSMSYRRHLPPELSNDTSMTREELWR